MNLSKLVSIGRSLLAFVLAFWLLGLIPVFFLPFNGCSVGSTWPGCSIWPEVMRGALFTSVLLLVGPNSRRHLGAAGLVFLVLSLSGGPFAIMRGEHLDINSIEDLAWQSMHGAKFTMGGLIATLEVFVIRWGWSLQQPRRAFHIHPSITGTITKENDVGVSNNA